MQVLPSERSLIIVRLYPVPGDPRRAISLNSSYFEPEVLEQFRNEPALHHYQNTYREALGMERLEFV